MKFRLTYGGFMCVVLMILFTFICNVSATIVAYSAPPGLITSPDFTVKANDVPILGGTNRQ